MQERFFQPLLEPDNNREDIQKLIAIANKYRGRINNTHIEMFVSKIKNPASYQEACEEFLLILRNHDTVEKNRGVQTDSGLNVRPCQNPNIELCFAVGVYAIIGTMMGMGLALTAGTIQGIFNEVNVVAATNLLFVTTGAGTCGGGMYGVYENIDARYIRRLQLKNDIETITDFLKNISPRMQLMA